MSAMAELLTAIVGLLTVLGGAVAWLWGRVEKGFKEVRAELKKCQHREKRAAATTAKQLIVIELLWQIAPKNRTAADVLERCKHLLEELKRPPTEEDEDD